MHGHDQPCWLAREYSDQYEEQKNILMNYIVPRQIGCKGKFICKQPAIIGLVVFYENCLNVHSSVASPKI